jgi:hypothetical protein
MNIEVDLIYVVHSDGRREMSASVIGDDRDKLIGPVPGREAVKNLAPGLQSHLPDRFSTVDEAATHLMFVHFRNMSRGQNSAGVDYPKRF